MIDRAHPKTGEMKRSRSKLKGMCPLERDHLGDGILPFQSCLNIAYRVVHNSVIRQLEPPNTMFFNPYLYNEVHW